METNLYQPQFANWSVLTSENVVPLSHWVAFCMALGDAASRLPRDNSKRYVVGVSVPTRGYVSAFVSAGFWVGRALTYNACSSRTHFDELWKLPNMMGATYARIHSDTKVWTLYKGYLLKPKTEDRLRFCYGPNDLCWSVDVDSSVFVTATGVLASPHTQNRKPTELHIGGAFWEGAGLSPQATAMVAANRSIGVTIIGVKGQVQNEFEQISLLPNEGSEVSMKISDIAKLKLPRRTSGFQTDIVSSIDKHDYDIVPDWTLFDARISFPRQHRRYRRSHWLLIADRLNDQQHTDTVQELNKIYVGAKKREDISRHFPKPPRGIGMTAFAMEAM